MEPEEVLDAMIRAPLDPGAPADLIALAGARSTTAALGDLPLS